MKKFLEDLLKRKRAEITSLQERSNASEDVNEVRSIGAQIDGINAEIREAQAQLDSIVAAEQNAGQGAPVVEERGFNPMGTYGIGNAEIRDEFAGTTDSMEYRNAFMDFVLRNTPISAEVRANANTTTTDVASVIPNVLVAKIIEKMEHCGMILSRVTRTAYAAGVTIPTSSVKPVATWVAEGATSDRQKKSTGKITFAYFKLRCEISMSMEVGTMALAVFEAKFVENVAKAMVIAIEKAIIAGAGTAQPKGILTETGTTVNIAAAIPTYDELCKIEAAVPVEYETASVYLMTKAQFMNFMSMVDKNGQPIARVNYGIGGHVERTLLGREVIVHPYAEEMGSNAAVVVDLADYVLNTVYDMGISKKQDWETEDLLTKAVMSVDGKMVSTDSLIKVVAAA